MGLIMECVADAMGWISRQESFSQTVLAGKCYKQVYLVSSIKCFLWLQIVPNSSQGDDDSFLVTLGSANEQSLQEFLQRINLTLSSYAGIAPPNQTWNFKRGPRGWVPRFYDLRDGTILAEAGQLPFADFQLLCGFQIYEFLKNSILLELQLLIF